MSLLLRRLLAAALAALKDVLHQNYGSTTGTPTLIPGALTDGNQALRLSSSDTWVVADSASSSLAVADGAAGGAAMSGWFSVPSLPGSTQTILGKVGSFELKITSAGKLQWILTNGVNTVTVTSTATIVPGTWYHFAGVYNGDYTGTPIFGNQVQGSLQYGIPPDYRAGVATGLSNLNVGSFTIPEKGQITSVAVDLQRYYDATSNQDLAAVVYEVNDDGSFGRLLGQSAPQRLGGTSDRAWVVFPCVCSAFPGLVGLGVVSGAIFGSDLTSMMIGYENTGGTFRQRNSVVSDGTVVTGINGTAADPFGAPVVTNASQLAIYANYTPTGRTGAEGKALIYLNGQLDNSAAYAHGIADSANNFQHPAGVAVDLDDWAIWNKKLTLVQVATHFNAR